MTIKNMTNHHLTHNRDRSKGHTITGVVIAAVGFFWFAKKIGWIPVAAGGSPLFWPAVTIAAGIVLILSAQRRHKRYDTGNIPAKTEQPGH
jgi:hypothetical protein